MVSITFFGNIASVRDKETYNFYYDVDVLTLVIQMTIKKPIISTIM